MTINPWHDIWSRPRETMRVLLAENPEKDVLLIAMLAGVLNVLDRAEWRSLGESWPLYAILALAVFGGPISGAITLYLGSWFLGVAGRWLGGQGTPVGLRAAFAWSSVPSLMGYPLWVAQLIMYGSQSFKSEFEFSGDNLMAVVPMLLLFVFSLAFSVWHIVLLCHCLAEVHGFKSAWRGFGTMWLAVAIVLVPILLLAGLIVGVKSLA